MDINRKVARLGPSAYNRGGGLGSELVTLEKDAHEVPEGATFERHPLRRLAHHPELQLQGAWGGV